LECGEADLAQIMRRDKFDAIYLRFCWKQMLEAVQTIHEEKEDARIIHGDLKPANFVMVGGRLKLIDFGIAKTIQNDTTNIVRDNQVCTSMHCLC